MTPADAERRALQRLREDTARRMDAMPTTHDDVRTLIAAHDALADALRAAEARAVAAEAQRNAADARHAALAGAVRAYLDADRDWRRSRYMIAEHINAAAVENTERLSVERYAAWAALDALLRGAPGGCVPARVVASYKAAVERIADLDDDSPESVAAFRAARTALEAALAAATTTPEGST